MTVKQVIAELQKYPDNMEVFLAERKTEFDYGLVNSVSWKNIGMAEEPGEEPMAFEKVVIIDEE